MTRRAPGTFRFLLTAGACLALLPLKMIKGWSGEDGFPLFSAWAMDACFLLWLCALGVLLGGKAPLRRALVGGLAFALLELPALFTIAAHTYFLEEATARQFSLLDASPSAVSFFLTEVVEPLTLLEAAGAFALLCGLALVLARRIPAPPRRFALAALGAVTALVLVHQATCRFYPSVLWEVGRDVGEAFSHPAVEGGAEAPELADAGSGRPAAFPEASAFDKVIVFVMESVPLRTLEAAAAGLPKDAFFNREREHAHAYTSYFATDMDSRTGMLAMLFARMVPFEAYSERDARRYLFLKGERSLLDDLAARGYRAAFAAAETDEEIVVFELPTWDDKLVLSDAEFSNHGEHLCFNPYEFEHDCEDEILLPRLYDELDRNERVFLFQEGVYGHIGDYEDATGKSPSQYYGEHLAALESHLAARGELDRTLIVVTSDHGIRDWGYRARRWTYRLPLLFLNPRFEHEERPGLYNQSDFAAILAAEMAGARPPEPREASAFVGCTNSSVVGSVTAEGDLLVIKNRKWRQYVLADGHCATDDEPDGPPRHRVDGAALIRAFARMQEAFVPKSKIAP